MLEKTFEILYEQGRPYKNFDMVDIGDIGKDYFGEECVVLYKCKAKEAQHARSMCKFDIDVYGIQEGISEGEIDPDEGCVFVTIIEGDAKGSKVAYVYGSDGVTVSE